VLLVWPLHRRRDPGYDGDRATGQMFWEKFDFLLSLKRN
jgi:hypothetical protein